MGASESSESAIAYSHDSVSDVEKLDAGADFGDDTAAFVARSCGLDLAHCLPDVC